MAQSNDYDIRTVRHQIRRGVTSGAEYQKYLDSLEDSAEMAEETETRFDNPYEKRHFGIETGEEEPAAEEPSFEA